MLHLDITTILAVWGAALSTIAIIWNVYRDVTDRGSLRVACYFAKLNGPGPPDPRDYLVWRVSNAGLQPIVLTQIGGAHRETHFMVMPRCSLPKTLLPGEYVLEYSSDLTIFSAELRFLAAWDSLNRVYKISRKNLRDVQREFAELQAPATGRPRAV